MIYDHQLTDLGLPSTGSLGGPVLANRMDRSAYATSLNESQMASFLDLLEQTARDEAQSLAEQDFQDYVDNPFGLKDIEAFSPSCDGKQPPDGNIYGIKKDSLGRYQVIAVGLAPVGCLEYPVNINWNFVDPYRWGWSGLVPRSTVEEAMDREYPCSHPDLEAQSDWNPNWNQGAVSASPILCSKIARVYTLLRARNVDKIFTVQNILEWENQRLSVWSKNVINGIAWIEGGELHYQGRERFSLPLNSDEAKYCLTFADLLEKNDCTEAMPSSTS